MDQTLLTQTDETKEPKASLRLEGSQLALLNIENPQIGQHIMLEIDACITSINSYEDEKGQRRMSMTFDVDRVLKEEPEKDPYQQVQDLYPVMRGS